jgi:hypothetical protein
MSLTLVVAGNQINAADLNQTINVLQQPSGGHENAKYWIAGWANASGDLVSQYYPSISRGSTPASITTDEADNAHANCNAISSDHLTQYGVHIYTTSTGAIANGCNVAGNLTYNY